MGTEVKAADEEHVELWIYFELTDATLAGKMFEALIDPYDNSGQVGDGNLINNMELAAAAIYFQILGGVLAGNPTLRSARLSSLCL